jgi:hypothetical protein
MAAINTRNSRYLLSATLAGTYVPVAGAHGYKENVPTDFSKSTVYGSRFESYVPGLQDYKGTLMRWYDTADATVEKMSIGKISEYFLFYPDFANPLDYTRGQTYLGQDESDHDLGKTADQKYTAVIANGDIQIVRGGAVL